MKSMSWLSDYRKYRFLEMLPGSLVWSTFFVAIIGTIFFPLVMVYVAIIFYFYWMAKIVYVSFFLLVSFRQYKQVMRTDWVALCHQLIHYPEIYHVVFIPNATEGRSVVETTFAALARTTYPKDKIIIVFAAEQRSPSSVANGLAMQQQYEQDFYKVLISQHPNGLPGELAAKGANLAWAGQTVKAEVIDALQLPYDKVIVTVLDVDTCLEPQYFHYLTYTYLTHPHPTRSSYQPIPMFNNNIWDAPAIMRVAATGTTFWLMSEQVRPERLLTFSSHSMSWQALVDVGFWQRDIISDDSRIFLQCFLEYDGDYEVTPLHMPVYMDTVRSDTWWKSLKNLFKQQQRWGWGSENIPFMIWHFWPQLNLPSKIPLKKRLWHLGNQLEGMWSWGTASILTLFLGFAPFWVIHYQHNSSVIATTGPQLLQYMLIIANVGLIISVILGTLILPQRPVHYKSSKFIMMIIQWLLLPISTICFGAFPAISAQTRLMLGKYLGFYVTEKSRRQN